VLPETGEPLPVSEFPEIWGYVVTGQEAALKSSLPISDVAYFGAGLDTYGTLVGVPSRRSLGNFSGRVHLVVADSSRSLTHFVLVPESRQRQALVADILAAAKNFDGLQIDFENVPPRDGDNFLSFLNELRAGLGDGKALSIALYARTRNVGDVYDYEKIAPIMDRVIVMAYDEHWSGSAPGPISSLEWGRRVAAYSLNVIGRDKLVMGLPFYGRAWASSNHARALIYDTIQKVARENNVTEIERKDGIPTFRYDATISVTVFFEDEYSLAVRMDMYRNMGVAAIGFWRVGQETQLVWNRLKLGS
jgi:spore germination protein YaaH